MGKKLTNVKVGNVQKAPGELVNKAGTSTVKVPGGSKKRGPILETTFTNPPHDGTDPNWPANVCSRTTFPDDPPRWTWKQIFAPQDEFDRDVAGLSGWVVNPNISDRDVWFLHPFGFDWEGFVAPDPQYQSLVGPRNKGHDKLYDEATAHATNDLKLAVPNGVLGFEMDQDLVPADFRNWVEDGDRIALFGRWIVDCGHDDFHTEIHPPLLMAVAKPIAVGHDPNHPGHPLPSERLESTFVKVVTRPYLVSQEFGDGALKEHIEKETAKVLGGILFPLSLRVEAHPQIMPKPFAGLHVLDLTVRPPSARISPADQLKVSFHFTHRSSCAMQVIDAGDDAVRIIIVLNEAGYIPPPLPKKHDLTVTVEEIKEADPEVGGIYEKLIFATLFFNPLGREVLKRGILTDRYEAPQALSEHDNENVVMAAPLGQSFANMGASLDDSQPFPLYGWLNIGWQREIVIGTGGATTKVGASTT